MGGSKSRVCIGKGGAVIQIKGSDTTHLLFSFTVPTVHVLYDSFSRAAAQTRKARDLLNCKWRKQQIKQQENTSKRHQTSTTSQQKSTHTNTNTKQEQ